MKATDLLEFQVGRLNDIVQNLASAIDVETSRERAFPGASLIGYTFWHLARTVDWTVNCMIRGEPEVAFDFGFRGAADPRTSQIGFGIQQHEADLIAEATTPAEVARYFELVTTEVIGWLRSDPDLSAVPDTPAHQPDFPGYRTDFYLEEARSYKEANWNALQMLAGPVVGHVRGHFGEIDVLRQVIRAQS